MQTATARSYLFVPATRTERVSKALAAGPDLVIVDLEDAVAPGDKQSAREAAARDLSGVGGLCVRINGPESEWFEDDLRLCARLAVAGVLIPKAEEVGAIRRAAQVLKPGTPILPLIETARGFASLAALGAEPGVQRFVFGSIDFQLDLGIEGEGDELIYFRSGLVLASRLAGLQPPVDGVTTEINDAQRVKDDAQRGKRMGFGAKLCIHPRQVTPVNECFQPTADEIAWAKRIVEAAAAANGAAVAVDGKMVDRPVILKAEAILRR
ncbi:MAG TPA: CoA ester lyase [Burkholderiales bacterium]|nr:CoA ester lyase [Burkholderiales bacterium]